MSGNPDDPIYDDELEADDFDDDGYGPLPPPKPKDTKPVAEEPAGPPPIEDEFQKFAKDPRLNSELPTRPNPRPLPPGYQDLRKRLDAAVDEQDFFDQLRLYKRECHKHIQQLEDEPLLNRRRILNELSNVAACILLAAYDQAVATLQERFGHATYTNSYLQICEASMAVVCMGKQGAGEINYESDLDLIFIYSHTGETRGKKVITNGEFFSKIGQRLISLLSVPTGAGKCYDIDTELRPSGNAGTLVVSYQHFLDHQMNQSQNWERLALLRAKPSAGDAGFLDILDAQIDRLNYERPLSPDFFPDMHAIRERVLNEKVKEQENTIDLKLGPGGLMDIDFIAQGWQLKNAKIFPELRTRSLFELLAALRQHRLFPVAELETLDTAYTLLRSVESHLQLIKKRSEYLVDFNSADFAAIAEQLKSPDVTTLKNELLELRQAVRKIYLRIYQ